MLITKHSQLTGATNTMDLPVTEAQILHWQQSGALIQREFPHLNASQREFLMTGATPEEWDRIIGCEPDDDEVEQNAPPF